MYSTSHVFSQADFASFAPSLLQLDQVPKKLFVHSKFSEKEVKNILKKPAVSIVGTRRPTGSGIFATHKITSEICGMSQNDISIVSGFMYGIDQAAHKAAIQAGATTICVLAHGFDCIPWRDKDFFTQVISAGGIFISEYQPQAKAQKWTFIARNRIVAALGEVIIVPEAALKSGSMHTVDFGLHLGKEIGAVPGLITNPYAEGTRWLHNQGATMVVSGKNVLQMNTVLQRYLCPVAHSCYTHDHYTKSSKGDNTANTSLLSSSSSLLSSSEDACQKHILTALAAQPMSTDQISNAYAFSLQKTQKILSDLEISGRIFQDNGQWVLQYYST